VTSAQRALVVVSMEADLGEGGLGGLFQPRVTDLVVETYRIGPLVQPMWVSPNKTTEYHLTGMVSESERQE
jgi:hypothetical protein